LIRAASGHHLVIRRDALLSEINSAGLPMLKRDLIRTRTAEGRSRAKAQGKHMGRLPSLSSLFTPTQQKEAIRRRAQGATLDELARSHNVSRATISRLRLGPNRVEFPRH
jgi:hypothetical protein